MVPERAQTVGPIEPIGVEASAAGTRRVVSQPGRLVMHRRYDGANAREG